MGVYGAVVRAGGSKVARLLRGKNAQEAAKALRTLENAQNKKSNLLQARSDSRDVETLKIVDKAIKWFNKNTATSTPKKVKTKDLSRWGIFRLKKFSKNNFWINDVVEKPTINSAPSNYAVIGRYILPTKIFDILKKLKPSQNGEIHITDAIRKLIHKKEKFIGHVFAGKYLDCGTMKGYINSSLEISKI